MSLEENISHCFKEYPKMQARIEELETKVDELSMLVRMLVHSVRKTNPDNETARKAMDYLQRHNLQGSILRDILRDEADYGAGDCVHTRCPGGHMKFQQLRARFFWWWHTRRPGWIKNHFVKQEYIVLTYDGTPCTMRPADACDTLQDADDPKVYAVKSVWMTPHQFDAIPEFQGW